MCGFLVVYGDYDRNSLSRSLKKIKHRGPDSISEVYLNKLYMGHTRLAIIDTSDNGIQPMYSNDNNFIIVFNGEIYNFLSLRQDLLNQGVLFNSYTDTEVLLCLYQKYGDSFLNKINGIFSLIIYDIRKDIYFVARDHLGIKPLYFYKNNNTLIFSSEIKTFISLVEKKIDYDAIQKYLIFMWCPGSQTGYKNIYKFPPGFAAYCSGVNINKMWSWYTTDLSIKHSKENDVISKTRKLFEKAVERQLVSDVPLGAFLSGGVDSSAIVSIASRYKKDIQCFTINTNDNDLEISADYNSANIISKNLGLDLHTVSINENDILENICNIVYHMDEPICDPAAFNTYFISKLAKSYGTKVVLSGTGGDDIFTGYRRHHAISLNNTALKLFGHKSCDATYKFLNELFGKYYKNRRFNKLLKVLANNNGKYLPQYFHWLDEKATKSLFNNDIADYLESSPVDKDLCAHLNNIRYTKNDLIKCLALEQDFYLPDHNLTYSDKMSMAHGVELRVPFLDIDLVRYVNNIDIDIKYKNFNSKFILKKIIKEYIPSYIVNRKKVGFGLPLRIWLNGELFPLIEEYLSVQAIEEVGIFNYNKVNEIVRLNKKGHIDASYTIFSMIICQIWFKLFFKKNYDHPELLH